MSSGANPAPAPGNPDLEEQRVRIRRMIDESEKFAGEQRKLFAEALKLECDRALAPWQIVFSSMAAGAAFFGAAQRSSSCLVREVSACRCRWKA